MRIQYNQYGKTYNYNPIEYKDKPDYSVLVSVIMIVLVIGMIALVSFAIHI